MANGSLESLNLAGNFIEHDGATAVAAAIIGRNGQRGRALTELNLTVNRLGAEGARVISEALGADRSLTTLSMASNDIAGDAAHRLASAVLEKDPPLDNFGPIPLDELRCDSIDEIDLSRKGLAGPEVLVLAGVLQRNHGEYNLARVRCGGSMDRASKRAIEAANLKRDRAVKLDFRAPKPVKDSGRRRASSQF